MEHRACPTTLLLRAGPRFVQRLCHHTRPHPTTAEPAAVATPRTEANRAARPRRRTVRCRFRSVSLLIGISSGHLVSAASRRSEFCAVTWKSPGRAGGPSVSRSTLLAHEVPAAPAAVGIPWAEQALIRHVAMDAVLRTRLWSLVDDEGQDNAVRRELSALLGYVEGLAKGDCRGQFRCADCRYSVGRAVSNTGGCRPSDAAVRGRWHCTHRKGPGP